MKTLPPFVVTLTTEEMRWLNFIARSGISLLRELVLLLSERS